ncbi:MAG: DUF3489 domain-containing protein [Erythrobacter sp.]
MSKTLQSAPTKTQIVEKLLRRRSGASIADIQEQTNWKPHSVRAFLSGLRSKGSVIEREVHKSKGSVYRVRKAAEVAKTANEAGVAK